MQSSVGNDDQDLLHFIIERFAKAKINILNLLISLKI